MLNSFLGNCAFVFHGFAAFRNPTILNNNTCLAGSSSRPAKCRTSRADSSCLMKHIYIYIYTHIHIYIYIYTYYTNIYTHLMISFTSARPQTSFAHRASNRSRPGTFFTSCFDRYSIKAIYHVLVFYSGCLRNHSTLASY